MVNALSSVDISNPERKHCMIGIIGTGSMGSAIAEGLLAADRDVIVFNRTRDKTEPLAKLGARVASSPAELFEASDLVITVLPDADTTRDLLFAPETRPALSGKMLLNIAHTTPREIEELAKSVKEAGAVLSEVNVTVYPGPVRDRQGHFNLACSPEHRETWSAVFRDLGDHVHYVGPVGNASRAEFALWLSYMFNPIAVAYSAAAFAKLGLPKEALVSALSENPTLRFASSEILIPQMLSGKYETDTYSVDNFAYSVDLVLADAEKLGLPTELFVSVRDLFKKASHLGHGADDISAVFEALMAGTKNGRAK